MMTRRAGLALLPQFPDLAEMDEAPGAVEWQRREMRRVLHATVIVWHLFGIVCLFYLIGLLNPSRASFLRKQLWAPVTSWVRLGRFFQFTTGRAALLFFLVALATAIFVLAVYVLRRETGWLVMFAWNVLGAANFFPSSWKLRQFAAAAILSGVFAAMALACFLARPRSPGST